jgi:hypothetical protein
MERDKGCRCCGSTEQLEAHHRTYARFGKELAEDITILCGGCHDLITGMQMRLRDDVRSVPAPIRSTMVVDRISESRNHDIPILTRAPLTIERIRKDPVGEIPRPGRNAGR